MCPQSVGYHDLEFDRYIPVRVAAADSQCLPFTRWVPIGMPRIPQKFISTVLFLYKDVPSAKRGGKGGGTGFFVTVPSEQHSDHQHLYAVTNWHVACNGGASVIRINTPDGEPKIIDKAPEDWEFVAKTGSDIAVTPIDPLEPLLSQKIAPIGTRAFALDDSEDPDISVGEDVFMVGRFVDHDGGKVNTPSARFGCISMMPVPITQKTGKVVDCYRLDMHSRTGYSGSPVFVYRTPGTDLHLMEENHLFDTGSGFLWFLGIHVGQFPEALKVLAPANKEKYVKAPCGMTYVSPASGILEVLMIDKFRQQRAEKDAELLQERIENGFPPEPESAGGISGDDILETMLETPPETHKEVKGKRSH